MRIKILLGIIFLFFFSISPVAAVDKILINEILADPPSGQGEWVELYSPSGQFDLANWSLQDAAGSKQSLANIEICGNFAVYQYSRDGWLNNTGKESLYLLDQNNNRSDQLIDFTNPGEGKTLGRIPDGSSNWQAISSPSRCSTNGSIQESSPAPSQTPGSPISGNVELSEFMPNPADGKEWVEVHNPSGQAVDIKGYKIDDIEGGSAPFTIPSGTVVNPGSYFVFYFDSQRFNNDGDSVRLLDSSGFVIDSYSYQDSQEGISFAKDSSGNWSETSTPTPGRANQIVSPQNESADTTAKSSGKTSSKTEGQTSKSESKEPAKSKSTSGVISQGQVLSLTAASLPALLNATASNNLSEATGGAAVKSSKSNLQGAIFLILAGVIILGSGALRFWKKRK